MREKEKELPSASSAERYAHLCATFLAREGIQPSETRGFGATALTVKGRIFAMLPRDRLVVKLPRRRVDELVAAGWGERFDANKGRPMKEWLVVDPAREDDWSELAMEALNFVRSPP